MDARANYMMLKSDSINWWDTLRNLDTGEIRKVELCLSVRKLEKKRKLFRQGEKAEAAFIIKKGRLKLMSYTATGKVFTNGIWGTGYIVGLMSAYLEEQRFIGAEAVGDTEVYVFRRDDLVRCMMEIPKFSLNIARVLAKQASNSVKQRSLLAVESATARVCRLLVKIAEPIVVNGVVERAEVSGVSQQEIANMTGVSRIWVNKILGDLERKRIVQKGRVHIDVIDWRRLVEMTEG